MKKTFTENEAQRIFALAAERQQRTAEPEPTQLTLADLEEAGRAAGIDAAHIRAAAADLMHPDRLPVLNDVLGVPAEVRVTAVLPDVSFEDAWSDALQRLRDYTGKMGLIESTSTGRLWKSAADAVQGPTRLLVEQEETGVRVTIESNRTKKLTGTLIGAGLFMAVALGIALVSVTSGNGEELFVSALFVLISLAVAGSAWFKERRTGRRDAANLPQLLAEIQRAHRTDGIAPAPRIGLEDAEDEREASGVRAGRRVAE
ncbi:MAG: hypothetical protein R2834_22255 [Rhodothermales bacterium]